MKKSLTYEAVAMVTAIIGAFILVGVYLPIINPGLSEIETHRDAPSILYYVILTPIPLLILGASWHFNRRAQMLKKNGE